MTQGGVRTPGKATPPHLCDFVMERPPPLPPVAVVDDFLHGALHVILHARRVFPPDVFERRRLFDVAARGTSSSTSTSPESSSAPAICWSAASSTHSSSVLAPPARTARPAVLERFRIDVRLPAAGSLSVHADALHASLRGFLLRLHVCDALLAPLPAGAELSFTAELHTRSTSASQPLPAALREAWAETDAGAGPHGGCAAAAGAMAGAGRAEPFVVPLSSLDVGGFRCLLRRRPYDRPTHLHTRISHDATQLSLQRSATTTCRTSTWELWLELVTARVSLGDCW